MNVICPINDTICFNGCSLPCKTPEIAKAALNIPKEPQTVFEGILKPFIDAQKFVDIDSETLEDNETEIHKIAVKIPI